jgi:hypothetical protein
VASALVNQAAQIACHFYGIRDLAGHAEALSVHEIEPLFDPLDAHIVPVQPAVDACQGFP